MARFDMTCLRMLITGGSRLSSSIRMDVMEKIPTIRYVREGYGLNECGIVCLTYPREKKNSVTAAKLADAADDHELPVGLPNMYTQIKIVNRQTGMYSEQYQGLFLAMLYIVLQRNENLNIDFIHNRSSSWWTR